MWIWSPIYILAYFCIHVHNIITSYHNIFFPITISRISRVFWCKVTLNQTSTKGKEGFPLNKLRQRSSATTWIRGYDPLDMVSLILMERHPLIQSSPIKYVDQSSTSNIFLCLPREILENIAYICHAYHCITGFSHTGLLIFLLFISVRWIWNKTTEISKFKMPSSRNF